MLFIVQTNAHETTKIVIKSVEKENSWNAPKLH